MADGKSTIVGADGVPVERPATFLTADEAQLLRDYQRWGEMHGLFGTMKCQQCGGDMEVFVQGDIGLFCSCRSLVWRAS